MQSKPQRHSRQRQVILEELRKLHSHPTAFALFELVRRRLPKISLGTVYRNLEVLSRAGAIQKLEFSSGEARYDGTAHDHDHLRCVRCGCVDDAPAVPLAPWGGTSEDWCGYHIFGRRLEYYGLCPRCQAAEDVDSLPEASNRRKQANTLSQPNQQETGHAQSEGSGSFQ